MTGTDSHQLVAVARELRRLRRSSPGRRADLELWHVQTQRFSSWMHANVPGLRLPPLVIFYLHDADLRLKDPACRESQEGALDALIADLEREVMPEHRGISISLHPRWLGVAALVVLAVALFCIAS